VRDVVVDGTGELVRTGDAIALGSAIASLAADPERRRAYGQAAQRHVLAHFGAERLVSDIDALYRELIRARAAGRES
jgi:mannosyltransferase